MCVGFERQSDGGCFFWKGAMKIFAPFGKNKRALKISTLQDHLFQTFLTIPCKRTQMDS